MRFASFMVVGPGEADRYLEQALKQLWVDDICIVLNKADPKTRAIAKKYGQLVVEDNREWGKEQWRIKQDFLDQVTQQVKPDWIWCLDSDEIFDERFTRAKAEQLASGKDIAFYFWCLQLWNDENQVRVDLSFPNIRFYKVVPDLGLHFQATPLHCGLAPRYAYQWGSQSEFYFKHYGLMYYEDRQRKIARYDRYDPKEQYKGHSWYAALRNENIRPRPLEEIINKLPETIYKRREIKTTMRKDKQIFMFRNPHGKPVPAVGQMQREQFIKMGYTELSTISVNAHPEAPVIEKPEAEDIPSTGEIGTVYKTDPVPQTEYKAEKPKSKGRGKSKKTV